MEYGLKDTFGLAIKVLVNQGSRPQRDGEGNGCQSWIQGTSRDAQLIRF
jgi:hypothetical protein